MISTLKTLESFRTKALELGFEFPNKATRYEIPEENLVEGRVRDSHKIFKQVDKARRYWEFRMIKDETNGSYMVMAGVFDIKTQKAIQVELSHSHAAKIVMDYGEVEFEIRKSLYEKDELGVIDPKIVHLGDVKWTQPKLQVIHLRR